MVLIFEMTKRVRCGDTAEIDVLKDGFNGVTAVTQTENIAWVLAGKMNPNASGPAKVYAVPLSEK